MAGIWRPTRRIQSMDLRKVTAHKSWHEHDTSEEILNWLGNEWADSLAKKAAMRYAPPQPDLEAADR